MIRRVLLVLLLSPLAALAQTGNSASLSWSMPNGNTVTTYGFNIYRCSSAVSTCSTFAKPTTGTSAWQPLVGGLPSTTLSYTDSNLTANTTYYYSVTSYNTVVANSESSGSNVVSKAMPAATATAPLPPAGLAAQ